MATTIEQVKRMLDDEQIEYAVASQYENTLFLPFSIIIVRVEVVEDGEGVLFQVSQVFNLNGCPYRCEVLEWMAWNTMTRKVGHFGYDPSDGEVDVSYFLPLEDGTLSQRVLMRCIFAVVKMALEEVNSLRVVAFTGRAPDCELIELPNGSSNDHSNNMN